MISFSVARIEAYCWRDQFLLRLPLRVFPSIIAIDLIFEKSMQSPAGLGPETESGIICCFSSVALTHTFFNIIYLGRVDKRDSHQALNMSQAGICDVNELGTRPYVGRRVGVL